MNCFHDYCYRCYYRYHYKPKSPGEMCCRERTCGEAQRQVHLFGDDDGGGGVGDGDGGDDDGGGDVGGGDDGGDDDDDENDDHHHLKPSSPLWRAASEAKDIFQEVNLF